MDNETVQIKRYPNRRYYSRSASKYVSLGEIEDMVKCGKKVEIRDSQTGDDITRSVLTQIIVERQPDKMLLFPKDMLHLILRSNEVTADFLQDYFRQSLAYLHYLQQHGASVPSLARPMHWVREWLNAMGAGNTNEAKDSDADDLQPHEEPAELADRLEKLEERLKELENKT